MTPAATYCLIAFWVENLLIYAVCVMPWPPGSQPKPPDNRVETTEVGLNSRRTEADWGRMERAVQKMSNSWGFYTETGWGSPAKTYHEAIQWFIYPGISHTYPISYRP